MFSSLTKSSLQGDKNFSRFLKIILNNTYYGQFLRVPCFPSPWGIKFPELFSPKPESKHMTADKLPSKTCCPEF
jgi:hypothetical protein